MKNVTNKTTIQETTNLKDLKSLELELANLKIVMQEAISKDSREMIEKLREQIRNVEESISEYKMSKKGSY